MISEEARLYLVLTILSSALQKFFKTLRSTLQKMAPAWRPVSPAVIAWRDFMAACKTGSMPHDALTFRAWSHELRSTRGAKSPRQTFDFDEGFGID